jgi:predicted PurR-regulated permease PerM
MVKSSKKIYRDTIMWLGFWVLFVVFLSTFKSVLLPFVAGVVIAYFLDPIVDKFEKFKFSRTLSVVIVLSLVILVVVPIAFLLINSINNQIFKFIEVLPEYANSFSEKVQPIIANIIDKFSDEDIKNINALIKENILKTVTVIAKMIGGIITSGIAVVNLLSLLLITPIVAFYMLRDWDVLVNKIDDLLPRSYADSIRAQFRDINEILAGFLRGQLTVCVILGTYYSIGLLLVGLDLGLVVGFLAGLVSFIPYVGSILGFIVSVALALAQFSEWTPILYVCLVFFSGQFFEGNFLTPKLVGDSVRLHPVWVMFALLAGGVLLGFLGLLIAVPVAAVIGVLIRHGILKYKNSDFYLG